jgi:type IV secretory pathway VirB10-like protein
MRRPSVYRRHRPLGGLLLATLALLLALPAHAQWRWRDASGRVTASDIPPPREIPDKDILQRPGAARPPLPSAPAAAAASAAPAPAPPVDKELEARKKAADQQQQARAKADEQRLAAVRAENCTRARSHLANLESGQRLARVNDKGEREFLDDKTRADEARRAREIIASDCR